MRPKKKFIPYFYIFSESNWALWKKLKNITALKYFKGIALKCDTWDGLRCCPTTCCICFIYPCQTPGVCSTSKVLGKGEGGQPLYLSHAQCLSTIKSSIVLSDKLSCYGSRHLNERQDFGIEFSVVSLSNNCFSTHPIPFTECLGFLLYYVSSKPVSHPPCSLQTKSLGHCPTLFH